MQECSGKEGIVRFGHSRLGRHIALSRRERERESEELERDLEDISGLSELRRAGEGLEVLLRRDAALDRLERDEQEVEEAVAGCGSRGLGLVLPPHTADDAEDEIDADSNSLDLVLVFRRQDLREETREAVQPNRQDLLRNDGISTTECLDKQVHVVRGRLAVKGRAHEARQ